jgi:transcriptional regulator with XRE-family HTH domain
LLYADTIETLTAFMQDRGISQRDLALRLGRSEPWISRVLNGRENTTLKTVAELAWGLGLRMRLAPEPLESGDDLGDSSNWVLKHRRQSVRSVRQQTTKGAEMAKKPAVVTGPHPGGGWQNKVEGNSRASNVSPTKSEAQTKGRQMAIDRHAEHKIQNKDGKIAQRNSYGHDPYPPKG